MKKVMLKIAHYLWLRRNNIFSIYNSLVKNPNINFDGKTSFNEILEYTKEISTGLLEENVDTVVCGNDYTKKLERKIGKNKHKLLVEYKQSVNSCAIYGNTRALIYNTGIELSRDEVESISNHAVRQGYRKRNRGMTFKNAAKASEEWLSENKGIEIETIRVPYKSEQYNTLKELGYACALGGQWTDEKTIDIQEDGVVDFQYTWKEKKKYGHCWTEEEVGQFTDNYPNKKVNRWTNDMFEEFINNGYAFVWCYFPIAIDENSPIKLRDAIAAKEDGIWNGERPQDNATREEVAAMVYRSK